MLVFGFASNWITWCKAWLNYSIAKNQTGLAETWASLE